MMLDTELKFTCSKCEIPKIRDEFGHRNRIRNKRCKACCATAVRKVYETSVVYRAATKSKNARNALENNLYIYQYLKTHTCVDCGESDPLVLEFDHIQPESKTQNITAMTRCSRETIEKELAICVVRCANCHSRKTAKERNSIRYQLSQNVGLRELVSVPVLMVDRRRGPRPRKITIELNCEFCGERFIPTGRQIKRHSLGHSVFCKVKCSNQIKTRSSKKDGIIAAIKEHPEKKYVMISREFGVTRVYVGLLARQIEKMQPKLYPGEFK